MPMTPLRWLLCHPHSGVRVAVAGNLNCNHGKVGQWCDLCGMKFNASKAKTMIISTSPTMHLQSSLLTIGGTVVKESDDIDISGMPFD